MIFLSKARKEDEFSNEALLLARYILSNPEDIIEIVGLSETGRVRLLHKVNKLLSAGSSAADK